MPGILGPVVAAVWLIAKQKAAQVALQAAITIAGKVLKAAGEKGGAQAQKAAERFEEAAKRYEELAAAELDSRKRAWFRFIEADAKAAAAIFRDLSKLIEQNANDATIASAVAKAAESLKQLIARKRTPPAIE